MKVGYARVSTLDQNLDMQLDALKAEGCDRVFTDTASGRKDDRLGLGEALTYLREGDSLVVWKLDRFFRSSKHFTRVMEELRAKKIGFKSIMEPFLDTSGGEDDPMAKFIIDLFALLAELDGNITRLRVNEGLKAARARGRVGGRPKHPLLSDPKKLAMVRSLYEAKQHTIAELQQMFGIKSKDTLYRYLKDGKTEATPAS